MAFFSGVFDFFKSYGRHEIKGLSIDGQIPSTPNPSNFKLAGQSISTEDKEILKRYQAEINKLGKDGLKSLLKEFYFQLKDKREMQKTLYELRNNDVIKTIIDVMIDDGLTSSNNSKIFTITYEGELYQEDIQSHLDKFIEKFQLDSIVLDFIDEAIVLGEYIMPFEHKKGIGITKILDNPYMIDMVALYDGQNKEGFLKLEGNETIEYPSDYAIHFLTSYKKVRVAIEEFNLSSSTKYLNKHIKVGQSLLLPIVNKLKQLELLEMANLALDLKRILAPVLVMVGMPENTQVTDIGEIVEEYEKILGNIFKDLGTTEDIKFSDILSIAGEFKVLPSIGDTKGSINTLNIGEEKESNQEKSESLRKSIALLLGIPFYYLSLVGENGMSRLESLKLFSRYSRKLNALQDCIIKGVKELLFIHLEDLGYKISIKDLNIKMRQITNVELLDSMEYLVTIVTALQDLLNVLNSVKDLTDGKIQINEEKLMTLLNKLLKEFPECEELLYLNEENKKKEVLNNMPIHNLGVVNSSNSKRTNLSKDGLKSLNTIVDRLKGKINENIS